jgi:hypothetical protein
VGGGRRERGARALPGAESGAALSAGGAEAGPAVGAAVSEGGRVMRPGIAHGVCSPSFLNQPPAHQRQYTCVPGGQQPNAVLLRPRAAQHLAAPGCPALHNPTPPTACTPASPHKRLSHTHTPPRRMTPSDTPAHQRSALRSSSARCSLQGMPGGPGSGGGGQGALGLPSATNSQQSRQGAAAAAVPGAPGARPSGGSSTRCSRWAAACAGLRALRMRGLLAACLQGRRGPWYLPLWGGRRPNHDV